MKTDFECSLYLESLTRVCAKGIAPLEESLDKYTRLSGLSTFTKYNREDWTLDISEGCDTRSVDAAIRTAFSPNTL
jgi:hypothetical protein